MAPIIFILSIIFTLFATAILAYVSMTSMIGPWLAPSIALLGSFLVRRLYPKTSNHATQYHVASLQAVSAGGGTIAVGVGFALPMLYFLDPIFFSNLISKPGLFVFYVGITIFCAGSLGILLASRYVKTFIIDQNLPFPSSKLTFNVIQAQGESLQTSFLGLGFFISAMICFVRDGIKSFSGFFPKVLNLFNFFGNDISISLSPMLFAIGFSVGSTIMMPLAVGFVSKIFLYPIVKGLSSQFSYMNSDSFSIGMGFCSGLILSGILWGVFSQIKSKSNIFFKTFFHMINKGFFNCLKLQKIHSFFNLCKFLFVEIAVWIACFVFLLVAGFNFFSTIFLLVATSIATYQICSISGHIGMVQFGRFSTFIMIPMILLFSLSSIHLTLICLFFHICAASASDHLFDFNIFRLGNFPTKNLLIYQFIGLIVTALSLGFILWILFTSFQLGSPDLFAQRAQGKALLIQTFSFDGISLFCGLVFGVVLKFFKINPTMALGGLLMPSSIIISLLFGSLISLFFEKSDKSSSLCAGILSGESVWVIVAAIFKAFL